MSDQGFQSYFLRAQFCLALPPLLSVTHGDIFQIVGKNRSDGTLSAINVFTGERGILPRVSENIYIEVNRRDVGYVQPVLMVGSLSSHVHDLLIARRHDLFSTPVPHTTRPRRMNEKHGTEYWFVKTSTMESMLKSKLFVECGKLGDFLYGTTEASIRNVAQREKKHCLLDASFDIPHLLARSLFPIVIFVGAQSWRQIQDIISFDGGSEYQAKELIMKDRETEKNMEKYLSGVVKERTLEESYKRVLEIVERLGKDTWIPQTVDPHGRLI